MKFDKTSVPGHWVPVGAVVPRSIRKWRRREYVKAYGPVPTDVRVVAGCSVEQCMNPECATTGPHSRERTAQAVVDGFREPDATVVSVAKALGLSNGYTRDILAKAGMVSPGVRRWHPSPEEAERVELLIREGVPDRWIAEDMNVSTQQVRDLRAKLGVENKEWVKVQLACRKIKALAPLHELFNPGLSVTQ